MHFKNLTKYGKQFVKMLDKQSPIILTATGITAGVVTVGLAIKATIEAMDLIEIEKCERIERDEPEEITKKEILKVVWRPFVPVVISGTFSAACIIGSYSVHSRRNAALATAYKISETAFNNFKDKAVEELGEKKVKEIQKQAANEHMEKTPVKSSEVYVIGNGKSLCFDDVTGRYFESDMNTIEKAMIECNKILMNNMYCSFNEFNERVGLPCTPHCNDIGWNSDQYPIELIKGSRIADDDRPCIVVSFNVTPRYDYTNLH